MHKAFIMYTVILEYLLRSFIHNHQQCLYNVIKDKLSKNLFLQVKDVVYKLNFTKIPNDKISHCRLS